MCIAVTILPVMDAISKQLTTGYHPVQIAAVRFGFLLMLLAPLAWRRSGPAALAPLDRRLLMVRGILLSLSSIFFVSALAHVALATAQSIVLVFPLAVTAASPLVLGEKVGPVRKAAVAVGFVGALLIIRPGFGTLGIGELLALASALVYAAYALMTRRMAPMLAGRTSRLTQLLWTVAGASLLTGSAAPFFWTQPTPGDLALMAVCGVLSGMAHLLLIVAYSEAEAATVVPFSYLQIAFGAAIGYAVWGTLPDALSWGGIGLIAGSGIVVALRSRTPPQARGGGRM